MRNLLRKKSGFLIAGTAAICMLTARASADPAENPKPVESEAAQETRALAFVEEHHPELAELLKQLQSNDQPAYLKALRELASAQKRLSEMETRDPERYALELKAWKLTSRANLIAARYSMGGTDQQKEELRGALKELADVRLESYRLTRDRLRERLEDVERTLAKAEQERSEFIEKRMGQLLKSRKDNRDAKSKAPKEKTPAKDGPKK